MPVNPNAEDVEEPSVPPELALLIDAERVNRHDRTAVFDNIRAYMRGEHHLPRPPRNHSRQSRAVQESSVTNLLPMLVSSHAELLQVDGYRRGAIFSGSKAEVPPLAGDRSDTYPPEYMVWKKERMDARQGQVFAAALKYGVSYVWADNRMGKDRVRYVQLPTRNTVAYYRDPVNDAYPEAVVWFKRRPYVASDSDQPRGKKDLPGRIVVITTTQVIEYDWPQTGKFKLASKPTVGPDAEEVPATWDHGLSQTPVVRFYFNMDDEGACSGIVAPSIPAQNRLNLAVFNADILNTNSAFKQWWASGLTPPPILDANGKQLKDPITGQPLFGKVDTSPTELLIAPDPDTKFGEMAETPQDGHANHITGAMRNLAIAGRLAPHALLGNLSNLSAEALDAAEASFQRWIRGVLQRWFGQQVEELLRLTAEAIGDEDGASAYGGEVRWEEFAMRSFGATLDGLGKAAEMLGVPRRALWALIPGVTSGQLDSWDAMRADQEVEDAQAADADARDASDREAIQEAARRPYEPPRAPTAREIPDASMTNDNGGRGGLTYA